MHFLPRIIPVLCVLLIVSVTAYGQDSEKKAIIKGTEIGLDFTFGGDDIGNHFGTGLKFGMNLKNYLVVGPVFRYNRLNFLRLPSYFPRNFNSFGGGGFMQLRFAKFLSIGLEVSVHKSPYSTQNAVFKIEEGGTWAASAFASAGFSYEIKELIRVEALVMYDVLDLDNSTFKASYPIYEAGNEYTPIPIMYQLGIFIPLSRKPQFYE